MSDGEKRTFRSLLLDAVQQVGVPPERMSIVWHGPLVGTSIATFWEAGLADHEVEATYEVTIDDTLRVTDWKPRVSRPPDT